MAALESNSTLVMWVWLSTCKQGSYTIGTNAAIQRPGVHFIVTCIFTLSVFVGMDGYW